MNSGLRLLYNLKFSIMLKIQIDIGSRIIFVDKIRYKKVKYLYF